MPLDEIGLTRLLKTQDGVVARRQVLSLGGTTADIRRKRRRREWARLHPGVYLDHTGIPSQRQRQWAAVLACGHDAALHRASALEAHGLSRDRPPGPKSRLIHVAVDASRRVDPPPGIRVERVAALAAWVTAPRRPPRVSVEFATLKEASGRTEPQVIALLADVCRQGLTTPARLLEAVEGLGRLPGRGLMVEVLADVAAGSHSVLEQRYLEQVERAHGLPRASRQCREVPGGNVVFRDVRYVDHATLVELDGRFGHTDTDDRWDDLDRDVTAAVAGDLTLRLGWRQVLEPCRVAAAVTAVLGARGWRQEPSQCGPGCDVGGRSESSGDRGAPRTAPGA